MSDSPCKFENFFDEYPDIKENYHNIYIEKTIYLKFIKRLFDILFAVIVGFLSFPIIMLFGIFIKIESKGPMFYMQKRVGKNGKYFNVIKLRSMRNDAEDKSGPQWAKKADPRVTKIGKFIRKTRIDELPQLYNVLVGDMSLIGPRPERPMFTKQFSDEVYGFSDRLLVKPGLTGWAQVKGGYDLSPTDKLEKDLFYMRNIGFSLELKIFLLTILIVINGNGAR